MVTVSRWRDATLVHIREYDGEEPNVFPTKRGLALTPAEFKALVALAKTIEHDVEQKEPGPSSSMSQQQQQQQPRQAPRPCTLSRGREVGSSLDNARTPRSQRHQGASAERGDRELQAPVPKRRCPETAEQEEDDDVFYPDSQVF